MRWKPKCSISTHPTFVAIVIRSTGHLCTSIVYTMAELFFGCNTFFFINWTRNIYRQQTKFAKVMFSQVSVCLQRGLCPEGVSVQRYLCPEGVSVQGMSLFRGCLSGGSLGGLCLVVSVQGISVQGEGGLCQGRLHVGGTHPTGIHSCLLVIP